MIINQIENKNPTQPSPEEDKSEKNTSTTNKVKSVVYSILCSVALLGSLAILLSTIKESQAFQSGENAERELNRLKRSNDLEWQNKALDLIEKHRKENPQEELSRLRGCGVLQPEIEGKLDSSIRNVLPYWHFNEVKKLMSEALELKQLYQETHHVFIHAQSSPWLPISDLIRQLWMKKNPQDNLDHFHPLRIPNSVAPPGVIESTYRVINSINPLGNTGINLYRNRSLQFLTLSDSDLRVREELLSVDGYFFNDSPYESSLFFLINNSNILDKSKIRNIAEAAIQHFAPSISPTKLHSLAQQVSQVNYDSPCGHLFVICIPKEKSKELQYRAHPFGLACSCHPPEKDNEILESFQKNQLPKNARCASLIPKPTVPQYRLYLPKIRPQDEKIFLLTATPKKEHHQIEKKIHEIIRQIQPQEWITQKEAWM